MDTNAATMVRTRVPVQQLANKFAAATRVAGCHHHTPGYHGTVYVVLTSTIVLDCKDMAILPVVVGSEELFY